MKTETKKNITHFSLIFMAFMLLQPIMSLLFQLPQSLYVFKAIGETFEINSLDSYGREIAIITNLSAIILIYPLKTRKLGLKLAAILFSVAIIGHGIIGVQLPTYGEAVTSSMGMIQTGDHWNAIGEARRNGFSRFEVLLEPSGYTLFVPKGYDKGLSFILYLLALGLTALQLKWHSKVTTPKREKPSPFTDSKSQPD
ncbi:hypothetical protein [Shewanella woodyi]|nr:hypothetical protein [Shewanella woodyi]